MQETHKDHEPKINTPTPSTILHSTLIEEHAPSSSSTLLNSLQKKYTHFFISFHYMPKTKPNQKKGTASLLLLLYIMRYYQKAHNIANFKCIRGTNQGQFKRQNVRQSTRTCIVNSLNIRTIVSRDLPSSNNQHFIICLNTICTCKVIILKYEYRSDTNNNDIKLETVIFEPLTDQLQVCSEINSCKLTGHFQRVGKYTQDHRQPELKIQ